MGSHWRVRNRAADLLEGFVRLVSAVQPTRVLILPSEMGFVRCGPARAGGGAFVQSWESLLSRLPGSGAEALRRYERIAHPVVGTFHFYDPRSFTHTRAEWAREWHVSTGGARIRAIFDAVRDAVPALPFYIGEFGLDVAEREEWHRTDGRHADGAEWLRAVRARRVMTA